MRSGRSPGSRGWGRCRPDWKITRLKCIAEVRPSGVDKSIEDGQIPMRFLGTDTVYNTSEIHNSLELQATTASSSEREKFALLEGDIIVTKDSVVPTRIADVAIVTEPLDNVVCGYHLFLVRVDEANHVARYHYYYLASIARQYFLCKAQGTTIIGISKDAVSTAYMLCPPKSEQSAIAIYLDRETAQIDSLIEKKKQQIALLKEKRITLISHAVTKGLDPNATMKNSGVAWLGKVPEHWEVLACKFGYSTRLGKMLQNDPQSPADIQIPYLKAAHVQWDSVSVADLPVMWASPDDREKFSVKNGDLLVCEGGEAGRAGILGGATGECIIQNALHRVRAKSGNDIRYLMHLLEIASNGGWVDVVCNKATIAHLTGEKLNALAIALPPPAEQTAIADHIDRETTRTNLLVEKIEKSIDFLREHRTALISAAVTGKIDVR